MKIIRAKGGTGEKVLDLDSLQIPDLWHLAGALAASGLFYINNMADPEKPHNAGDVVLDVWHLVHDLKKNLERIQAGLEEIVNAPYYKAKPHNETSQRGIVRGQLENLLAGREIGDYGKGKDK